jgi:UDP-perosamine 4-acetyltransferase
MRDAVLIGGGGHAMSCLDGCDAGDLRFVGYLSPEPDDRLPLEHLGDDSALPALRRAGLSAAFVAIGDNERRAKMSALVAGAGFDLVPLVASTARVSSYAELGPGSAVLHGALVGPRSQIGAGAIVNTAASVDHDCVVGDFAHIAPGSHLAGGVRIGTGTFAGVGVSVIPDVKVGDWAVVGAGAVVINDLAPAITAVGAPARARRVA